MRKLLLLKFAALLILGIWFWFRYTAVELAPDWHRGELVAILPPTDSLDQPFNWELAELFAQRLHAKIRPMPLLPYQVAPALADHQAHFSAIGMRSNEENPSYKFGESYQTLREKIVCNKPPKRLKDILTRNIVVAAGSEQDMTLRAARQNMPALRWRTVERKLPNTLLDEVSEGKIDCTVANEEQIATMRNFHPDMAATFNIATPSRLAWAFPPDADPELLAQARNFFEEIRQDGTLHRLLEKYYGHNDRLVPLDAAAFLDETRTVLPRYRKLFYEAAAISGIKWQLLAAMAYRESHWNPLATSPTGVRGIMMLTSDTADQMGVRNRLDARASILAGARYLRQLKDRLPQRIGEPDRTWLALAAYNQGMGHLEDARVLTQRRGLNPDRWVDVKRIMPRIGNPAVAQQLKYGSGRGGEAVIYVETVRLYYDMLRRMTRAKTPLPESPPRSLYSLILSKE